MSIEILDCGSADGIARLEAAWRELQQAGGVSHPMYTWEWMSTWWEVFGQDFSLVALIERRNGEVMAIAPFVRRRVWLNRLFCFRRMQLMGTGEDQRDEVFSEYVDFPLKPRIGPEALTGLAEGLLDLDGESKWSDVVLHRVLPGSAACRALRALAPERGFLVSLVSSGKCPLAVLPSTFEEYDRQLSSRRRQHLRQGIRALERMGEIAFEKADTIDAALATVRLLAELHQARWIAKGKRGVFASQRFTEFHRQFIRRTFRLGWPELWTLRVGKEPIACQYNIRYRGRVCFYQSGIKLVNDNRVSPGILTNYLAVRDAIETGAEEYDFMLGEAQYKLSLSNSVRELVTLRITRPSVKETLRQAACSVVGRVRRLRAGVGGRRP